MPLSLKRSQRVEDFKPDAKLLERRRNAVGEIERLVKSLQPIIPSQLDAADLGAA